MATVYIAEDDSNILEIETFALSNIGLTVQGFDKAAPLFAALAESLADIPHAPLRAFGWPADQVVPHGRTAELRAQFGLTPEAISELILKDL